MSEVEREAARQEAILLKAEAWELIRRGFAEDRHHLEAADRKLRQAEALCRSIGDREGLVGILGGRGAILRTSGEVDKLLAAVSLYTEEVGILADADREKEVAVYQSNIVAAYRDLATVDPEQAVEYIGRGLEIGQAALTVSQRLSDRAGMAQGSANLADLCVLLAEHDPELGENHLATAATLYRTAEELWTGVDDDGLAMARMGLAEVYIRLGRNFDGAEALLEQAGEFYGRSGDQSVGYQRSQVHALRARLLTAEGRPAEAADERRKAAEIMDRLGFGPGEPRR
ncbi:MAG: hypothetical protein ACYC6V_02640 [Bacillota bacterium]